MNVQKLPYRRKLETWPGRSGHSETKKLRFQPTESRNRHGSWRDGEGGALDDFAPFRPSSGWRRRLGGANGEQQKRRQAVSERPRHCRATDRIAGGRQPLQRQRSQWDATPSPSPCLKTAHALGASLACCTSHLHPRIASIAYIVEHSRRRRRSLSLSRRSLSLSRRKPQPKPQPA